MFGPGLDGEHVFGQHTRVSRTRVRRRRIALTLVGLALTGGLLGQAGSALGRSASEPRPRSVRYVVRSGDTLWAIAIKLVPASDPRRTVGRIIDSSGIDAGALVPGQSLIVPLQA